MRKLLFLFLLSLPLFCVAETEKKDSDAKYLAGAVTMKDGKVSFDEEISAPGLSKEELFDVMQQWITDWKESRENIVNVSINYSDKSEGKIGITVEDYLIFKSKFLLLDRTRVYYQVNIYLQDEICDVEVTNIHYWYEEQRDGGERYIAEEWITDDVALNKKKTKLVHEKGKFREKTIDLKDELFQSVAELLRKSRDEKFKSSDEYQDLLEKARRSYK